MLKDVLLTNFPHN